jgi:hypothetical protein
MNSNATQQTALTSGLVLLFAFCCGAIVANIYYAQPIIDMIAPDIGPRPAVSGAAG